MRFVPINAVREGCYLAKTIYDDNGMILLNKGILLTQKLIERAKNVGIYSLYINDDYSDNEIEDVIKPELRQKSIKNLKEAFDNFQKYNTHLAKCINGPQQKNALKNREKYIASISEIAKEILEELLSKKNILINLVDIKSMDSYTYQHSVNVAILSIILGIELQLNRFELYDLCVGAILHDIGKIFIPPEIITKNDKLTDEEFSIIKKHPIRGYEYLKNCLDIPATARAIVLQHHEKINGEGYPNGFKNNHISKLSRIVAIADVYDALTSDRPYRSALSPNEAMEYIMGSGGTHFDYVMVKAFSKKIIPYPEGTLIKLSNNDTAIVEGVNIGYPLRPSVRIIDTENPMRKNIHIDLLTEISIVIQGVQHEPPRKNQLPSNKVSC